MTDLQVIGQRIQQIRQAQTELSQTDLAIALGVSWPTVSRLERGKGKRLDLDRLHDVAQVLGVDVSELLKDAA